MATEKRLIDANALIDSGYDVTLDEVFPDWHELPESVKEAVCKHGQYLKKLIQQQPTVDAVELDKCNFKLHHILIDNEGVPEVKIQIGDRYFILHTDPVDIKEVVHGRWVLAKPRVKGRNATYRCTVCGKLRSSYYNDVFQWEYCPCGAKMDGDGNG